MGIEPYERYRLPPVHLLTSSHSEPAHDRIRPDIGPARGVVLALALGTVGWLVVLGVVLLIRDLL